MSGVCVVEGVIFKASLFLEWLRPSENEHPEFQLFRGLL